MTQAAKPRYIGAYNRLFPVKVSTNSCITIYIMHLLTQKGRLYGKEIINCMEDRFSGHWKPSHGLVYPILRELEEESLIKGEWGEDPNHKAIKVYEITKLGRKRYRMEKEHHKAIMIQCFDVMEKLMGDLYEDYRPIYWEEDEAASV